MRDRGEAGTALHGELPLVGRDSELAVAMEAIDRARPVVITGTGGVGKTRLLRALAATAHNSGWVVRRAVGTTTASSVPLGAVAHLIPSAALDAPRDGLLRAIARAIEDSAAAPGRVLVCLDDSHFLDDASATLVAHLARDVNPRLGMVIVVRSGKDVPDALDNVARDDDTQRIDLKPLGTADVGALMQVGLGAAIEPVTVKLLTRWTRGNLFFLRELLRDGVDSGLLRFDHGLWTWHGPPAVGPTLRDVISARHDRLAAAPRSLLDVLAIGEPLSLDVLARVASSEAIETLEREGLIEWDHDSSPPSIRLVHPLHSEALRATIPVSRANRLRVEIAEALMAASTSPSDRLRRAVLEADAGIVSDPDALIAAARRAWSLRDTALVERLAKAARSVCENPEADYLLGEVRADRGDYEGALASWLELLDRSLPDEVRVRATIAAAAVLALTLDRADDARAALDRATVVVTSADDVARLEASRAAFFVNAVPLDELRTGIESYADEELPDQARVFSWLASARERLMRGEFDSVLAEFDAITEVAERAGDDFPMAAMFVGVCRFFALVLTGRLHEAEVFSERNREASISDPLPIAPATWNQGLGIVALTGGHMAEALLHLGASAALLRGNDIGNLRHVLHELALAQALCGDYEAASASLAEATTTNAGLIDPFVEDIRIDAAILAGRGAVSAARDLLLGRMSTDGDSVAFYEVPRLHDAVRFGAAKVVRGRLAQLVGEFDGAVGDLYLAQADAFIGRGIDSIVDVAKRFAVIGFHLDAAETFAFAASVAEGHPASNRQTALLDREVETHLALCGPIRPCTPLLARRGPVKQLTTREEQIAQLAARGESDMAIARELTVSQRTVHAHLRSIYRKLGIQGRGEIASALQLPS